MMNSLLILTEVGLFALLLLLAFRMLTLVRTDPFVPAPIAAPTGNIQQPLKTQQPHHQQKRPVPAQQAFRSGRSDKGGLITQLHILLSLQVRDCRERGLDLETAPHAVREYAVAWLYGAACALCDKPQRHSDALLNLVSQLASRKTGIRQPEAVQALSTLTASATLLACFRNGACGAEHWSEHRYVPQDNSLYGAVTSNAFI